MINTQELLDALGARGLTVFPELVGPTEVRIKVDYGYVLLARDHNREDGWEAVFECPCHGQIPLEDGPVASSASAAEVANWAAWLAEDWSEAVMCDHVGTGRFKKYDGGNCPLLCERCYTVVGTWRT